MKRDKLFLDRVLLSEKCIIRQEDSDEKFAEFAELPSASSI